MATFEACKEAMNETRNRLEAYRVELSRSEGFAIKYHHPAQGKDKYQMEIKDTVKAPEDWRFQSKKKGYRRYNTVESKWLYYSTFTRSHKLQNKHSHTHIVTSMVEELIVQEQAQDAILKDVSRQMFQAFDQDYASTWSLLVDAASHMDCLISLAKISSLPNMCVPSFSSYDEPCLEVVQGRHPCVEAQLELSDHSSFIANDLALDHATGKCLLLTGPNMGGKSTLLRQTCVIAIMAQIGCHVSASKCVLSPVDRIFTRIGASDRILEGQSTFYVELSETVSRVMSVYIVLYVFDWCLIK